MGPLQVLPLQVWVDQGVMAMKGYSTFPEAPELKLHHPKIVLYPGYLFEDGVGCGTYLSAEMQPVYSTAPADWAVFICNFIL